MIEQVTWRDVERFVDEVELLHQHAHFKGVFGLAIR